MGQKPRAIAWVTGGEILTITGEEWASRLAREDRLVCAAAEAADEVMREWRCARMRARRLAKDQG